MCPTIWRAPLVTGVLTNGSGDYSFTGLAPGNYIVRVDQDNFDAGGNTSLVATPVSPVTIPEPPDPDDGDPDTDNDDNGSRVMGQAAFSKAITLAYNQEPTAGTGNDTNNTLDFGFLSNPPPVLTNLDGDTATFTEGDGSHSRRLKRAGTGRHRHRRPGQPQRRQPDRHRSAT